MAESVVYMNGQWVGSAQAAVPLWDTGFVLGATVSEQLRTFGGRIFRLDEHLRRLERSLEIAGIDPSVSLGELHSIAQRLVEQNWSRVASTNDLGLSILITPGPYSTLAPTGTDKQPTVILHTYPLPYVLWSEHYVTGLALGISSVLQVPTGCWPRELKCRSRMHYYLADREVGARWPGARALLLDERGCVTETATANILASFDGETLVSPPRSEILPGVTLEVVCELARKLGIEVAERPVSSSELLHAVEMLTTSTPSCILPVTRLNGHEVGAGSPGELYRRLLVAFQELVGVDIVAQACRHASAE